MAHIQPTSSPGKTTFKGLLQANLTVGVSLVFYLCYCFSERIAQPLSMLFLVGGFVFPGMTHGSLDFLIMNRYNGKQWSALKSLTFYLSLLAFILITWLFSPTIVLVLFLLNSAYHFGETDLRGGSTDSVSINFLYGVLLLSFVFMSHCTETIDYIKPFGIEVPTINGIPLQPICWSLLALILMLLFFNGRKSQLVEIPVSLIIGMKLPLILAFGIYYILIHSRSAWGDLKTELRLNESGMLKKAAPFTVAGCIFIAGIYWLLRNRLGFPDDPVLLLVAGLAAITLPHSIAMTLLYRSADKKHDQKVLC